MSRPIISPRNSDVSLRPLRKPSPERPTSSEPLADEAIDDSANVEFLNTRKPTGYTQVASEQGADDAALTPATPRLSTIRIWAFEVLSILLALSSLSAVVSILFIHQGQPLPEWPSFVSINALVAVFSAILKAALVMPVAEGIGQLKWRWFSAQPQEIGDISLFDQATRGPWGSLLLVARQLGRHNKAYLASFGAIITIGALAVDPFSQALLQHQLCRTPSNTSATVPRTNDYSGTATLTGVWHDAGSGPRMSTAIYEGLVRSQNAPSLNFDCPTGECDFGWDANEPYFSSLAMCSSCRKLTSGIERISSPDGDMEDPLETTYRLSGYNISHRTPMVTSTFWDDKPSVYSMNVLMLRSNKTCNLEGDRADCHLLDIYDFNNMQPFAARCHLQLCVKNYRARVKSHEYTEREIGTPTYLNEVQLDVSQDLVRQTAFSVLTNHTYSDGEEVDCNPVDNAGPSIIPFHPKANHPWSIVSPSTSPVLGSSTIKGEIKLYPRNCVWIFENFALAGLRRTVRKLMEGEVTGINFGYPYSLDKVEGNLWLVNAYNQGRGNLTTVGRMMQGLATSITAAMRNYPHESEYIDMEEGEDRDMMLERVALGSNIGLVYKVDTCIHVRWVWIIYPAILLILQVIFCATILLVRPTSTPGGKRDTAEFSDWKSSPLALVSLSWGEGVYQKLGHVSSVRDLEKAVGKTKVILQRGDSDDPKAPRWQLVDS